jgi:hypothetical protein
VVVVGADLGIDAPLRVVGVNIGVTPADNLYEIGGSRAWESGGALEDSGGRWDEASGS